LEPNVNNAAPTVAWEAESIRFSAFPPPSVHFEISPIWERLTGKRPDDVQERPNQGVRNEIGSLDGEFAFYALSQLTRLDLVIASKPTASATEGLISIGPFERAEAALLPFIADWIRIAPTAGRLAYAPIVLHRVKSVQEGNEMLHRLNPALPIDPANSRDIFWQINRPLPSKTLPELTINRLTKWSVLKSQRVQISTDISAVVASTPMEPFFAVRLELDLYTEPITPIPAESMQALLTELSGHSREIVQRGDVP
jgi:hypothetical protein